MWGKTDGEGRSCVQGAVMCRWPDNCFVSSAPLHLLHPRSSIFSHLEIPPCMLRSTESRILSPLVATEFRNKDAQALAAPRSVGTFLAQYHASAINHPCSVGHRSQHHWCVSITVPMHVHCARAWTKAVPVSAGLL